MKKIITNVSAKVQMPKGAMHIQVAFDMGTAAAPRTERCHIWLNEKGENDGNLYKNSYARRGEVGYFDTRHLDANNATNAPLIKEVLAQVDLDAVRKADAEEKAEEARERQLQADAQAHKQRCEAQAEKALALLERYMDACGSEGGYIPDCELIHMPELYAEGMEILKAAGLAK